MGHMNIKSSKGDMLGANSITICVMFVLLTNRKHFLSFKHIRPLERSIDIVYQKTSD